MSDVMNIAPRFSKILYVTLAVHIHYSSFLLQIKAEYTKFVNRT